MLRKLLSAFLLFAMFVPLAYAQTGSITGKVTDAESGESVPTANVLLVEITRGTATDAEGNYTISNIPVGTYTLRVTFVGYKSYQESVTIQAGQTLTKNIELEAGAIGLDELVVTGYGVETKRELTGSITKVSSQDFEDVPVQNTQGILQGRAAGVQVTTTSGAPGAGFQVRVRGTGSINAGSNPLYIVDGVQISENSAAATEEGDVSPLNSIPPNQIESIEILKDAAAAAIYGAQAANGVVLITTKRGQQGDTQFTASSEWGSTSNIKEFNLLGTPEWIDYMIDAFANSFGGGDEAVGEAIMRNQLPSFGYDSGIAFSELPSFDWQDFFFQEGFTQKYNLSASGGTETTRFFIAGGWEQTEGTIQTSNFERFNIRTNFDHQFTSKLNGKINFGLTNQIQDAVCEDGPFINCPVSAANFEPPISTPFTEDGEINPNTRFGFSTNPVNFLNEADRIVDVLSIIGNLSATYNFKPWLSLTTLAGLDYRTTRDEDVRSPVVSTSLNGSNNSSIATLFNFNVNSVLNGRYTFNEVHNVSGLLGAEYRREFVRELEATGSGFPNRLFRALNTAANPFGVSGFDQEFRIASYFGQAKYNYDERYYATVSLRYDGSSRFGADDRWGIFPSFSGSWRLSEESFFNVDMIDDLKIRGSYGVTGNSEIGNFDALSLYQAGGSYRGATALTPAQLANTNLTWEEAKEINLGVDYSLWAGRLSGSIDVYRRDNESLLLDRPLPGDSGFGSIRENVGEVRNEGIEFEFNSVNMDRSGFLWTSRFNIAIQKSEVLSLTQGLEQLGGGRVPIAVGQSQFANWVPIWAGVNPADGRPMWYDANGNITYDPATADNKFFDGAEQDVVGGFGNRFSYKGLSLDVFFQYSFGQTAFPAQEWFFMQTPTFVTGVWDDVLRRWQEPGQITDIPQVFFGDAAPGTANFRTTVGSNALFDASYIRLKNVTLSYNLPVSIVEKINLRGVRVYANGLNLITWTSWPGLDPEVAGTFTQASFPSSLQFNGGIELRF